MITATVSLGRLVPLIRQAPAMARPEMRQFVQTSARALVSSSGNVPGLVQVTPPAHASEGKLVGAAQAKAAGEMAITADLLGLGIQAGRSKHQRTAGVFVVMADDLLAKNAAMAKNGAVVRLFIKKDGTIYGTDRHNYRPKASTAEMYAHHQSMRRKSDGRVRTAGGATRDVGRWKFIDQMVVSRTAYLRYERMIHKRVGMMAAGVVAAYNGRFGPLRGVPAYAKRHTSGWVAGKLIELDAEDGYEVTISVEAGNMNSEMQRRFNYVLGYRMKAMQRQIPFIARRLEAKIAAQIARL